MASAILGACTKDVPLDRGTDASSQSFDEWGGDTIDDRSSSATCTGVAAQSDCATLAIAQEVCSLFSGPCHVCVQVQDSTGRAVRWMAVESPASCRCGQPYVDDGPDAGDASAPGDGSHTDGGTDSSLPGCGTGPACGAGEVCAYTTAGCAPASEPSCQPAASGADTSLYLFCSCDDVTFESATEHPTRPYLNEGTCPDLDF